MHASLRFVGGVLAAFLALVAGMNAQQPAQPPACAGVRQIVAHRGASLERPECTLAAFRRAIETGATAVEMDVRTSKDGVLFLLHDASLDRTTNGRGPAAKLTIEQLKQLDAGSWFDAKFKGERIPTLREALELCRGKIDVLLDLKEKGDAYAAAVSDAVRKFGEPQRTIVGVRSVQQAKRFRRLLPQSPQLGLIPGPDAVETFAAAGVETIRLWPRWLKGEPEKLIGRVRRTKAKLHLNGTTGAPEEILPLLKFRPDSLSSDDPARLVKTLADIAAKGRTVRMAGIVLKWLRTDKRANYMRAEKLIREAARGGAKLVCTTECFLDGYAIKDKSIPLDQYRALGEEIPAGPFYQKLAALADELDIYLVAGMLEADGEQRYNTAVLIDPRGKLAGKYRKQKLGHEAVRNTQGKSSPVFETPFGRLGLMICADRRYPDLVKRLGAEADFLLCPSGGMFGPKTNDPILQARSKENRLPIMFVHPAEFLVTGPNGDIHARTILGDRLEITPDEVGSGRDSMKVFYFDLPPAAARQPKKSSSSS